MSYSKYNVAIIPPKNVSDLAQEVSVTLSKNAHFQLNSTDVLPHISLYHIPLEKSALNETGTLLKKAMQIMASFEITAKEYYCHSGGWTGVSYERSPELMAVENRALNLLRNLWCRDFASEYENIPGEKGKNIQEYGWMPDRDFSRTLLFRE